MTWDIKLRYLLNDTRIAMLLTDVLKITLFYFNFIV